MSRTPCCPPQVGGLPTASSWRLLQPPPSSPPPELRSPSCWDRRVLRDPKRICVIPKESGRATRDAPRRGGHSGGRGGLPHSAGLCAWYWASASEPTVAVPCSTRARRLPKPSNPLSMMGVSALVVFLGLLFSQIFPRSGPICLQKSDVAILPGCSRRTSTYSGSRRPPPKRRL